MYRLGEEADFAPLLPGEPPGPAVLMGTPEGAPTLEQSLREAETPHKDGSSSTRVVLTLDIAGDEERAHRHWGAVETMEPRFVQQVEDGVVSLPLKKVKQSASVATSESQLAAGPGEAELSGEEIGPPATGAGTGVKAGIENAGDGTTLVTGDGTTLIGAGAETGTSARGAGAAEGPRIALQLEGLMPKLQSPGSCWARVSLMPSWALWLAKAGEMSWQRQKGLEVETFESELQQTGSTVLTELLDRKSKHGKSSSRTLLQSALGAAAGTCPAVM